MEALVVDPRQGARLGVKARLLMWLLSRCTEVGSVVIEHRNGVTTWIWCRGGRPHTPAEHLEYCFHSPSAEKNDHHH